MSNAPNPAGPYRKPQANLYTVLLLVALLALIAGCIFLYMEVDDYGQPPYKGAPANPVSVLPAGQDWIVPFVKSIVV